MAQSTEFSRQNFPPRSMRHAAKLLVSVIFLGITLTAMSSQAAQLYISPTGSDSHPCTQALPCLTLQHAVNVASSGDTINIEAGTYSPSITSIDRNLTILGAGASHTILQGFGRGSAAFVMDTFFSLVRISGVTISEGGETGILVNGGSVILEDCIVSNNFTQPNVVVGAGITNLSGVLTVIGSTITNNHSEVGIGGIENDGGVITIIQSTISGNSAGTGSGGGVANSQTTSNVAGLITINQSTISGNSASSGGGIFSAGGTVQVLNSTIAGNTASTNGGGIEVDNGSIVELNNTTIALNEANTGLSGGTGGGINVASGLVTLSNTIADVNLRKFSGFPFIIPNDCGTGQLLSSGYNLFGYLGKCSLVGPGTDRKGVNPLLGPLQNNGGPTETLLPQTGSPAIDAGNPAGCTDVFGSRLNVDQRGLPRPDAAEPRCDIGAVEVQ